MIAAASPVVHLGDVDANVQEILSVMLKHSDAELLLLPRLSLTGATLGDRFLRRELHAQAKKGLETLAAQSGACVVAVGLPYAEGERLYDTTAFLQNGRVLGLSHRKRLSWMESRWFSPGERDFRFTLDGRSVAVEEAADITLYPSAEPCFSGTHEALHSRLSRHPGVAVYACAGFGESTADHVYDGYAAVYQAGRLIAQGERFSLNATFAQPREAVIPRVCARPEFPFVPTTREGLDEIFEMQTLGLVTRLREISCRRLAVGVSGGLDSTLALLVAVHAFDRLGLDRRGIHALTMPGLATGARTKGNADGLMASLGVTSREIPIGPAVLRHLCDIGHDGVTPDVTYENAQARERTQILMDYANHIHGVVLGTGDLSEIALGFCTFGGDHLSMYNPNCTVPKTLVRALCAHLGDRFGVGELCRDVLATPISPELAPGQQTEAMIGSYQLHDFFLYHYLRGLDRKELLLLSGAEHEAQLDVFLRRFLTQQFKRNAMPDGPQVTAVSLSPRGGYMG